MNAQPVVNPTVAALNALQIYDPDQAAAYREHAKGVQAVLGPDFPTRLAQWVAEWTEHGGPAALILTGNAGTGKTAVAEAYCDVLGVRLPLKAAEIELVAWVGRDVSRPYVGGPSCGCPARARSEPLVPA